MTAAGSIGAAAVFPMRTGTPPPPADAGKLQPSAVLRLRRHWHLSAPTPLEWFGGGILWGLLMLASALVGLYLRHRLQTQHFGGLLLLYFAGGGLAWILMLPIARMFAHGRAAETRFAAFFLLLTCGTIAVTAFLYALDYRQFYAQWHEPVGSRIWVLQFLFTVAGAVYQFAVLGIRLYLPLGFLALLATSLLMARRMR